MEYVPAEMPQLQLPNINPFPYTTTGLLNSGSTNKTGDNMLGLAAAGVAALGGIISSIIGGKSQDKTNQANLEIQQMNNAFNERMLNKQLAYQTDMWNKTNEYNAPINQRKRLEAAGLNPYLMMDGGNAGSATAMSGGSASAGSPGNQQAYTPDLSSLSEAANMIIQERLTGSQARLNDAKTTNQQIENAYTQQKIVAGLENIAADTGNKKWQSKLNELNAGLMNDTYNQLVTRAGLENMNIIADTRNKLAQEMNTVLDANSKAISNQFLGEKLSNEIALQIAELRLKGQLTKESAQRTIKTAAEAENINLKNDILEDLSEDYVSAAKSSYKYTVDYNNSYTGSQKGYNDKIFGQNQRLLQYNDLTSKRDENDRRSRFWFKSLRAGLFSVDNW